MAALSDISLIRVSDGHFGHMLGEASPYSFVLPPGGVDGPGMIRMLRRLVGRLHEAGCFGHWMILDGEEIVGLCGYTRPPDDNKTVEIGYGIAPARRRRGFAMRAVALLLEEARADSAVTFVVAETGVDHVASARVLMANGFVRTGSRTDLEDGVLDVWGIAVRGVGACGVNG